MNRVGGKDQGPPKHIWRTFVGRSAFEFQSMLDSGDAGLFMSLEHLEGITKQWSALWRVSNLVYFGSLLIALLLMSQTETLTIDIGMPVFQLQDVSLTGPLLMFFMAILAAYYCALLVSMDLLRRQGQSVFEHVGLPTPQAISRYAYLASRWSAGSLWIDVLAFRAHGYRSGLSHLVLSCLLLLVMLAFLVIQLAIIFLAAYTAFAIARVEGGFAYYLVALPAFVMLHAAVLFVAIAFLVPFKFRRPVIEPAASISAHEPK